MLGIEFHIKLFNHHYKIKSVLASVNIYRILQYFITLKGFP